MAPYLLALMLLAQDAPTTASALADGPVATALPRKQTVAPLPIQGGPVQPPADDYGYVGWCYGALAGYVDLYERAMPEVERIERAWPTPSTEENIKIVYPGQRAEARETLPVLKRAMDAAEKASPTPIQNEGSAAIKKGRAIWTGATTVPPAQLAQFWMSWSPPAKCEETAKTLESRSNLLGQALTFNTPSAAADGDRPEVAEAPAKMEIPEDGLLPEGAVLADEAVTDGAEAPSAIDALAPEGEAAKREDAATEDAPPPLRGPQ